MTWNLRLYCCCKLRKMYNEPQKVFGQNWKSRTSTVNNNAIPVQRFVLGSQCHSEVSARWPGTSGQKLSMVWHWGYTLAIDFRFEKSATLSTSRSPPSMTSRNVVWVSASLDLEGLRRYLSVIYDKSFDIHKWVNLHGKSIYTTWKRCSASPFIKIQSAIH